MAKQLSIFAENKPGSLEKITSILSGKNINLRALTIASSEGFGIFKVLVDNPVEAFDALNKNNIPVQIKDIVAIYIDDKPGGLHKAIRAISKHNINIIDSYGFVVESGKKAIFVFELDKPQEAIKNLKKEKIRILTDSELYSL
ncbi:MAG: ACT domain-containing protein [Candidatus Aureabacteria bacterium]|nr:ACT domain-containing protein [Candidatus Auribacterota bacterium]